MNKAILLLIILLLLVSCVPTGSETPQMAGTNTKTQQTKTTRPEDTPIEPTGTAPLRTQVSTEILQTALPTMSRTQVFKTPSSEQLERWNEYQEALSKTFFPPPLEIEEPLCEWVIIEQEEQNLYIWAVCSGYHSPGELSSGSMPAVIVVDQSGNIQEIKTTENTPASSFKEAQQLLFSEEILQQLSNFNGERYFGHLEKRRENNEPPLIVLDATPTP